VGSAAHSTNKQVTAHIDKWSDAWGISAQSPSQSVNLRHK